ncbi:Tc5 transposase DNA-binding domain containing protein [Pyrenophora tritici-repentis]|uniref:Tc5 transposase DNA-binding domain containing protein n=1 Tax=Pyrenophora tritici-repentis TaxID=45151 RepID=A0A922SW07_9PLEO|nr:Tc5 transposase DNA-binding domain containing protein [Pyrenophora tritici-repentis]
MPLIDDVIADLESQEPEEKLVLAEFARKWSVSRATLSRRWRRVTGPRSNGYAQQQAISPQQELELVRYIKTLTERGLPPTREMVRNFSSEVAHQQLSESWVTRFINRHEIHLISKWTSAMDRTRHLADSESKYRLYFELLHRKITEYHLEARDIYNMDEKSNAASATSVNKNTMAGERTSSERAPVARTPAVGMASSSRRVVPTLEALLGTTNIKPREWHHIDPEMWEDNLEAPDDEVGITTATTYIARAIADYTDRPTADEELFWEFRQDFEGWTEAMFLRAQPIYTKELKRILRFKGVYTGRINMAPSESLARLLRMEEYLEWPQDVFQSAVFDTRSAAHMLQERALRQQRSEGSVQSTDRRLSSQAQSRTQTPVRTRGRDVDSRQTRDQDQTHVRVQGRQETVEEEQQIQDQLAKTIEKAQNQPIRSQPVETTESAPQPAYQRVQIYTSIPATSEGTERSPNCALW